MEKDVPIVVVKEVGKSYGTVEALKEVSFVVERGEIFGLIGPDGAGKSTLFKAMLGLISYDGGEIKIMGKTPKSIDNALQRIRGKIRNFSLSFWDKK